MLRCTPLTLFCLGLISGCAVHSSNRGNTWGGDVASRTGAVTIEVTNDLISEAKIYLLRSSERRMLGTVPAQRTSRFSVPARVICGLDVTLAAAPLDGSPGYTSEEFVTWPGQVLTFKIKGNGTFRFPDRE
jgi:hypothetical protein